MTDRTAQIVPREGQGLARSETGRIGSPLTVFDRFADEVERVFDDFGVGRGWFGSRWGRSWSAAPLRASSAAWIPEIEVHQRHNDLVVRADLPGLKKQDVSVEITDHDLTISGERRQEQQTERDGIYRSERTYGSFCRTIPLPEGAITDQAKASFHDGVLEVTLPAPPQLTRGRRLEIKEGAELKK